MDKDRIGIVASTLCAIHCAVTPLLLLILPTFGKIWSHPASHWGMALVVVPIAIAMMTAGYKRHRRKWIVAIGALGIALVLAGAATPYLESDKTEPLPSNEAAAAAESDEEVFTWKKGEELPEVDDAPFVYVAGDELPEAGCVDNCCPSLVKDENGNLRLHIPLASIITTLGGIALIVTHMGNLCCCATCRKKGKKSGSGEEL